MERTKITPTRALLALVAALLMVFGLSAAGHAVTIDGDLSDIRALPGAIELPDPLGFVDEPIDPDNLNWTCLGVPEGPVPNGYNIGSLVAAYDPSGNGTYYVGLDVSSGNADDAAFGTGCGAWDNDGDGDPTAPPTLPCFDLPVSYEVPGITDGDDEYRVTLLITPVEGIQISFRQAFAGVTLNVTAFTGAGPQPVPEAAPLPGVAGAGNATGDGPDIEFKIPNIRPAFPEITDLCEFYTVEIAGYGDTDSDASNEETVSREFFFDNPVTICKLDAQENPVEGWEFRVSVNAGPPDTYVTGADGCVEVLAPQDATLEICEQLAQDALNKISGDVLVNGVPVTPDDLGAGLYCVTVDADDCPVIQFMNECEAEIEVYKYNLECCDEANDPVPVEGFVFHITGGGLDEDLPPTDATGKTSITVDADETYTICESLPQVDIDKNKFCKVLVDDEPVDVPEPPWCVDVTVGCDEFEETHTVAFYNACEAEITVQKMNLEGCDPGADPVPTPEFEFTISGPGIDPPETLVTGAAGEPASITVHLPGTYLICETLPQGEKTEFCEVTVDGDPVDPIQDTDTWCAEVVVGCDPVGESYDVVFYNAGVPCSLQACKVDWNGDPIEGWEFQLWMADTSPVPVGDPVLTDACGCVVWPDLDEDVYIVTEQLPQTIGDCTYTKPDPDADVIITDNCAMTVTPVAPVELDPGLWGVEVPLTDCCEADLDVTVTFQNTCEVPVTICKIGIESAECDYTAPMNPAPNWNFTLKQLPDGPETPYSTEADGCTDPIDLEPGDYRVCEALDPNYLFCKIEVNGVETPPSYTEDTNMDGTDDLICYDFTIDCCGDIEPKEITFYNAAGRVTRTPGYWFTHPAALLAAFDCITGSEAGTIYLCEPDGCPVTANDAMAIFWTAKGSNRPTLAKHVLAAMFNDCLLSPAPGTIIEDALAVLCDPEATSTEIGDALGPVSDFNESGTEQEMEGFDYGNADPYEAKSMASMGMVPDCAEGKHTKDVTPRTRRR